MKGHVAKEHVHLFVSIPTAGDYQPPAAVVEREDGTPPDGGVSASEETGSGDGTCGHEDISAAVRAMSPMR